MILHPFGHRAGGPAVEKEPRQSARYAEFRMVALTGKDVMRWMEQCVDFVGRDPALAEAGIRAQSFADLLVRRTPPAVASRFESWGVTDYRRIVSRAIGINAVFPQPPDFRVLSAEFLDSYPLYADSLFQCYQGLTPFTALDSASFGFSLYTSDEYMSALGCRVDSEPA